MDVRQKVGSLGEELVVKFLMKQGYRVLDRNYRRPWGEIDIVAERKMKIHFVEVKTLSGLVKRHSVTHETYSAASGRRQVLEYIKSAHPKDWFRPEDHINKEKIKRQGRIIQTYLNRKHVSYETKWQFDVATVVLDKVSKTAKVELISDCIIE